MSVYWMCIYALVQCPHVSYILCSQLKRLKITACVRRWLARVHIRRTRVRMAQSAMTVQRYVRGWLTRKRLQQMRCEWEQRQKEERIREHRKQSIKERDSMQQQVQKVMVMKKLDKQQLISEKHSNNADKSTDNKGQTVDYRSHTIRMKRWLPEIEQKIKYAFNVLKNENEAVQFLLNLGLTTHEIDLVLQHFLTNAELNLRKKEQFQKMDNQQRNPLSAQEQQLELIGFSQSVHMLNQEVHKNLRRNKTGVHVDRIERLSPDYKRPPGFTLLPTLLNASMQNKSLDKNGRRHHIEPVQQQKSPNKFSAVVSKFASKSSQMDSSSPMTRHKPPSKNEMLSKIPKRKNSTASSKLTNKMRVSSSLAVQALNGASKPRIVSKRNNSNSNSNSSNCSNLPNTNQSKENERRTKLFNHSASSSPNGIALAISEKNQQTRRLLDFIQAQKSHAKDVRPPLNDNTTNEMRNGCSENSRKKSQIEMENRNGDDKAVHPFVPSKRLIQHHDYQNLVDDTKTTAAAAAAMAASVTATPSISVQSNRNRYDNCTFDSVVNTKGLVDRNNNRKYNDNERTKTPIYRHFGDTILLRSKGKQSPTQYNAMNSNNNNNNNNNINKNKKNSICGSSISLATTEPSMASFDKYQKVIKCSAYPEVQRFGADNRQLAQQIDAFPVVSTSYVTSNLTNDTGFGSMDTDAASIVTNKTKSKANHSKGDKFHMPFQCINYNIKNRIKMFDVDSSAYRKHTNNNDKSHSAGSSSNISSSNSNNSYNGFNSLDSMENDIQPNNGVRHKNRMPALITTTNSMSYLGPFNFRQLLRPVHEQNIRNVPQRRRQNLITSSKAVT